MGGGLMQLVAYGAQDIYLTGNPQITFFKVVYRRHTNFSMEHIQQTFKGTPAASARVVATISRNGDLVHDCYLKVKPDGAILTTQLNPGHNIIDNIECEIGGQLIDRQYGHWMEAHAELTQNIGARSSEGNNWNAPSGHGDTNFVVAAGHSIPSNFQLTAGAGGCIIDLAHNAYFYVPLQFWFNRHVGLSLPLIALQYHEVNIIVTFTGSAFTNVCNTNAPELWANYIYLDTDERRRFAQVSHEYLIEQIQLQEFSCSSSSSTFKLNFNHPVKELIWWFGATAWGSNDPTSGSLGAATGYGADYANTILLKLNGHDRFAAQSIDYFTRYQPIKYHTNYQCVSLVLDSIGVYSFALKPEEHQPSGTCNFSRIDSSQLIIEGGLAGTRTLYVYAVNYNVLRIMSGMGGLAYSN
jgi:hypothetical protein